MMADHYFFDLDTGQYSCSKKIVFDVGGVKYPTTINTISESDYLSELVTFYRYDSKTVFFIDRDGLLFRDILYYLRTEELFDIKDKSNLRRLKVEAKFFGLPRLENKINDALLENKINDVLNGSGNDFRQG